MSQIITQSLPDTQTPASQLKFDEIKDIWGKITPRRPFLPILDLSDEVYVFGRKETCNIHVTGRNMAPNLLGIISKEHFRISRDASFVPYIEDLSRNGTFLNGGQIGRGSVSSLCTGDIIAVGNAKLEVYQFHDESHNTTEYGRKYKETRFLGRGAFGEVYLAFSRANCHRFAVKKINRNRLIRGFLNHNNDTKIENEVKILKALKHPCVIHLQEIIYGIEYVHIILEYMEGGELNNRIIKKIRLSEEISKLFFYQMTLALQYLHKQGITHRDLKPENILLATHDDLTIIKVSDFGLSKVVDEGSVLKSLCGTPMFVAPEILRSNGLGAYTSQVDIWSLGVILYCCVCGHSPFTYDSDEPKSLFLQILRGQYAIPDDIVDNLSEELLDMIQKTLQVDPKKRIAQEDIFKHKWLKDSNMQATFKNLLIEHENKK